MQHICRLHIDLAVMPYNQLINTDIVSIIVTNGTGVLTFDTLPINYYADVVTNIGLHLVVVLQTRQRKIL